MKVAFFCCLYVSLSVCLSACRSEYPYLSLSRSLFRSLSFFLCTRWRMPFIIRAKVKKQFEHAGIRSLHKGYGNTLSSTWYWSYKKNRCLLLVINFSFCSAILWFCFTNALVSKQWSPGYPELLAWQAISVDFAWLELRPLRWKAKAIVAWSSCHFSVHAVNLRYALARFRSFLSRDVSSIWTLLKCVAEWQLI